MRARRARQRWVWLHESCRWTLCRDVRAAAKRGGRQLTRCLSAGLPCAQKQGLPGASTLCRQLPPCGAPVACPSLHANPPVPLSAVWALTLRSGCSYMDHKDLQVPPPLAPAPALEAPTCADGGGSSAAGAGGSGGAGGGCVTTDGLVTFNGAVVDVRSLQAQLVRARGPYMLRALPQPDAATGWWTQVCPSSGRESRPWTAVRAADKHAAGWRALDRPQSLRAHGLPHLSLVRAHRRAAQRRCGGRVARPPAWSAT